MKNKLLKALSVAIALCVLATACSSGGTGAGDSGSGSQPATPTQNTANTSPSGEKTSLQMWYWQAEMEEAWNNNFLSDFEKANPSIDVTLSVYPWANYWQKVQTAMVAKTLPDILLMSVAYIDKYAADGAVINLKPYIDRDLDRSQYYDQALQTVRCPDIKTGEEYAMPWNIVENCLFYNKDMFDTAGIAYPDESWTWDTLRETAIKLTKDTGDLATTQFGFSMPLAGESAYDSLIYSFGGRVVSEDLTKCMLDQPEAIKATQFLADMMLKDKCMPEAAPMGEATGTGFTSGRVAMGIDGCWTMDTIQTATKINWDIAPLPKGPAGRRPRAWSDSICISADSKYPDQAWEVIKFLVSDKGQTIANLTPTRIPVYIPNSLTKEWLASSGANTHKKVLIDMLPESSPFVFRNNWGEWVAAVDNEVYPAYTGDKTVEEALKSATKAVNLILSGK